MSLRSDMIPSVHDYPTDHSFHLLTRETAIITIMRNKNSRLSNVLTIQRLTQLAAAGATAKGVYDTVHTVYKTYHNRNARTIVVPGSADFWGQLLQDLTPHIVEDIRDHTAFVDYKKTKTPNAVMFSPSMGASFTVNLHGHKIKASLEQAPQSSRGSRSERLARSSPGDAYNSSAAFLTFHMRTEAAENAVRAFITTARKNAHLAETRIYSVTAYGNMSSARTPVRPPSSVILPGDTMGELLRDVDDFIENESYYIEHGLPYHRGYMLEGPPGTGKTSLIEAVAVHTARSLYTLALASFPNDSELQEAMAALPENAILVIEDIDTTRNASHNREVNKDPSNAGVTLGGLLNALDGLATPPGLITFMTTNAAEKLDPALLRNGRTDYHLHLGYLTQEHFDKMWAFYGDDATPAPTLPNNFLVPATVTEFAKQARTDKPLFKRLIREHFNKLAEAQEKEENK